MRLKNTKMINPFSKSFAKKIRMKLVIFFTKILFFIKLKKNMEQKVIFISEKNDWAIKIVAKNITKLINKKNRNFIKVVSSPKFFTNKVIHFGSQYMWVDWWRYLPINNNYIVSFFHGKEEDGDDVKRHIKNFLESVYVLKKIIVSNTIVQKRLLSWGVPLEKICLIPIGVDNAHFQPANYVQRKASREKYGIKNSTIVIGSFQKDGQGWGKGDMPKKIKGPDIFIKVVKSLKEQGYEVLVFLTGPARGYMKNELKKIHVNFLHKFFKDQNDLLSCYHALDVYLITSREEGGPMGLMEAMASGVPVVSSPVGMSVDLIKNKFSGLLSKDFQFHNISKLITDLIESNNLKSKIIKNGLIVVKEVNWDKISNKHYKNVYLPLIK